MDFMGADPVERVAGSITRGKCREPGEEKKARLPTGYSFCAHAYFFDAL
jgi:hypothetical protein